MARDAALIYLRISEDRTGSEAGVDRQRIDCRRRCRDRGWEVVAVESDNDLSAAGGKKRPGFEAMLGRIERGEVGHVVAWTLDRLQRNRRDELRLYEACRARGVTVSLVRGPDLDWETPAGRYMADNLGSLARMEIEVKSDRQKRANLQAREAGRMGWSRRPYGYDSRRGKIVVVPREAAALRESYARVMAGDTLASVTRWLNSAGHKTSIGGAWSQTQIRRILMNPRYIGTVTYNGEEMGDGDWPPIFSADEQRAITELMANPARLRHQGTAIKYLLSGIARCGICGDAMYSQPMVKKERGKTRRWHTYSCQKRHLGRRSDLVDEVVEAVVVARLSLPDGLDLLSPAADVGALRREAETLRARRDGLSELLAEGLLTPENARPQLRKIADSLGALERDIAAAMGTGPGRVLQGATPEGMAAAWAALAVGEKRSVIDALLTVHILPVGKGYKFAPEHVRVAWRD
jgi:site-specific DNA recombinase